MNFVKKYFYLTHLVFALSVFAMGFFIGQVTFKQPTVQAKTNDIKSYNITAKAQDEITKLAENMKNEEPTVKEGTKLVFIRKYSYDNSTNVSEETVTSAHLGKTKNEIAKMYEGWDIISFTDEKIVLSSNVDYYPEGIYLLSSYTDEGGSEVICVYSFDAKGEKHLYQIFDTPINIFDDETIEKLRNGIPAKSQEDMEKLLQDYE